MIGGEDIVVEGAFAFEDIDLFIRGLRFEWSNGVIQFSDGRTERIASVKPSRLASATEFYVYCTDDALVAWRDLGFTDKYGDQMISVIIEPDAICFVVDSASSASGALVMGIKEAIVFNRADLYEIEARMAA